MPDSEARCFGYLRLHVAQWVSDIDALSERIHAWQEAIIQETDKARDLNVDVTDTKSIASLSGSLRKSTLQQQTTSSGSGFSSITRTLRLSLPKRSAFSLWSGRGVFVPTTRRLDTGVWHYDAELQRRFETIVRDLHTGRSYVRGAINQTRIVSRTSDTSAYRPSKGQAPGASASQMHLQYRRTRDNRDPENTAADRQAYENLDTALAQSQDLCERAAYRLLRDGDCSDELAIVRRAFTKIGEDVEVLTMARVGSSIASVDDDEAVEMPRTGPKALSPTIYARQVLDSTLAALEVDDDSEDDDDDLDIRAVTHRLGSPRTRA